MPVRSEQSGGDIVRLDEVAGGAAMYARWLGKPPLDPMKVSEPMMRKLVNAAKTPRRFR